MKTDRKAKAFNPQIFLELLCYCVFGGLMIYLARSEKYLFYVTPRMKPYLYFTAIVMGVWAVTGVGRLFRPQYKIRSAHCYILAIPAVLLALSNQPMSISDLSGYFIGGNTLSGQANRSPYNASSENAAFPTDEPSSYSEDAPFSMDSSTDTQTDVPEEEFTVVLSGLDEANRKITVSDRDFSMWLTELYDNMKSYEGYTIIMTGYVFKDSELLNENEFAAARPMMSCCAADLAPAGLICQYDKASQLEANSWVTVEGILTIEQYEYEGTKYDDPQISVTKITPAEEVEGYIYPFY